MTALAKHGSENIYLTNTQGFIAVNRGVKDATETTSLTASETDPLVGALGSGAATEAAALEGGQKEAETTAASAVRCWGDYLSTSVSGSVRSGTTWEGRTQDGLGTVLAEVCVSGFTGATQEAMSWTTSIALQIGDGSTRCAKKRQPVVCPAMFAFLKQRNTGCVTVPLLRTNEVVVQEGAWLKVWQGKNNIRR